MSFPIGSRSDSNANPYFPVRNGRSQNPWDACVRQVAQPAIAAGCKISFPRLERPLQPKTFHVFPWGKYLGPLVDGRRQGHGMCIFRSGSRYEGDFQGGDMLGKGSFFFKRSDDGKYEGDVYKYTGDVRYGQMTGKGTVFYSNGSRYTGSFLEGKKHGRGIYICWNGDRMQGWFQHNQLVRIDIRKEIGSKLFLEMLLGLSPHGLTPDYPLHILSYILLLGGNKTVSDALISAFDMHLKVKAKGSSEVIPRIYAKLNNGEPQLLFFGMDRHSLSLNLVPRIPGYVDFEIYNSGYGLDEYHQQNPENGKFQTRKVIRVPLQSLNLKKILDTLFNHTKTIEEFYENISSQEQAHEAIEGLIPVWQTPQKGRNCFIEWMFAYFKCALPPQEYNAMRLKLFELCLEENIQKYGRDSKDGRVMKIREELIRKINKRKQRSTELQALTLPK